MIRGKLTLTSLGIVLLLLAVLCCKTAQAAGESTIGPIAILLSDSESAYITPVDDFIAGVEFTTTVYNLNGSINSDPSLKKKLFAARPSLIFALGAKAAFVAKLWTEERQDIPVIFAMVLNWQRYNFLDGQKNITGIAMETPPGSQFLTLTTFSPESKRIGVIYSKEHSKHFIDQATDAAKMLGLELIPLPIDQSQNFSWAYKQLLPTIDSFWVLNDPIVYTLNNIDWLKTRCIKDRILCIGQTENAAKLGLLLSVNPDYNNIGSQAASMAKNILLRGQKPVEIGVMGSLGTHILVNKSTAAKIDMKINENALATATAVIE